MGIHQLNVLLDEKSVPCFKYIPWSFFAGKRVAIDVDIFTYSNGSRQDDDYCSTINFFVADVDENIRLTKYVTSVTNTIVSKFVHKGVIPVVVFSGVAPHEKNLYARRDRAKNAATALENYNNYYAANKPEIGKEHSTSSTIYTKLAKLRAKTLRPPQNFDTHLATALATNGIIVLYAKAEAEELCSMLCLEGLVEAVYSTDTDNIVRRCPILITKIEYRDNGHHIYEMTAEVTEYSNNLPTCLGLDYAGFVDLCILMKCDYNDGIPRWGKKKCFDEMVKHKSIEKLALEHPTIDFNVLNYVRCREIFNLYHQRTSKESCSNPDVIDFIIPSSDVF